MIRIKQFLLILLSVFFSIKSYAQLPTGCPNGLVYMHTSPIQVYNPALPLSASNPSSTGVPSGGTGLSVGPNIFAATPANTFFTTIGGFYAYWSGTAWITTTVSTANSAAVNIASGPGCSYNLVGGTGQIYVTNGTNNSTLLTTITSFSGGGPYDLVVDNCCNFYVLKTTTPQSMTMYSPLGVPQCTYAMTGMPSTSAGGGFAIVGNQVIVSNVGGLYVGNMTSTSISFTNVSTNGYGAGDFASCPLPCGALTATAANTSSSTPIGCSGGTANVMVTSTLSPLSYTWSGPGIVSGINSATATVNQCGVYTATVSKAGCPPATTVVTTTIVCTATITPTLSISNSLTCTSPTAAITASPGPAGYTYTWTGPGIVGSANANPITANAGGVYTATVLNTTTLCRGTATINLPFNFTPPTLTVTPTNTSVCLGSSANLSVAGATTYTWSGVGLNTINGSAVVATPIASTTYSVIGSVGVCTTQATAIVNINPQPTGILTPSNASCGFNNGSIVITNTSGGGQAVTGFSLNGVGIPTQTVTGLAAGNYTITMINNFGCITNYTTSITNTPPITALATTSINPTCGQANGSITLGAVTGGSPTYSYNVNGGAYSTTPPLTNLGPGTYTIGVIDSKGCLFTKTVVLTNIAGPTAITFTTSPTACVGATGGFSVTNVTGGSPAYSFSVNGVSTGSIVGSLPAGTGTVLVKDVNGCTLTANFNITTVNGPISITTATTNATCGNANGTATVTSVSGGTGPYSYSFNGGAFGSNSVTGLAAGTQTVVIKDANSCTLTVNFNISNTGSPVSTIAASANVPCFGGTTGSFTVNTVGGLPAYGYTLSPGGTTSAIGIFTGLAAQPYTVTVKDAAGCVTTVSVNITQPTQLTLTLTPSPVLCNAGATGSISAASSGGTAPYNYSLNGGAFQLSGGFTGLTAGTYSVTVRDNNNCTVTKTVTITQPTPLALSFTTTPNTCVGAAGSVTIGVTGGTPVYSYSVNSVASGNTSTGLASGVQNAQVSDANGCIITGTFNIGIITGPTAATLTTSPATCGNSNGSATVTAVAGGTGPYQYSFNGGAFGVNTVSGLSAGSQTVIVKDANSCTVAVTFNINNTGSPTSNIAATTSVSCFGGNNGGFTVNTVGGTPGYNYTVTPGNITNTTGVFTGLTSQNYNVTIKDAVGCVTTVTVNIPQPTQLALSLTPAAVLCNAGNTGSISASASGGTSPYNYSLNGGAFQAGSNFTGLTAGTYSVTVRDNNNCTLTQTVTITQPTALTMNFNTAPNSCAGSVGSVTINVSGGTPVYSYSVNSTLIAGNTSTGLTSGVNNAQVSDANGCVLTGTYNIGNITGPATATIATTNANCGNANGSATVTGVTGGAAPYQYSFNGSPFSTNAFVGGQLAGTFPLVVLDANSCTLTVNYTVGNTGSPVSNIAGQTNVSCFNGLNGTFTVNTAGGTPGYSYTLTPGNITGGTGVFTNLSAQAYNVLVKDAAGCVTTVSVTINQPSALTISLTSNPTSCNTGTNGSITAAGTGGTGPYQFSLNGGAFQSGTTFSNQAAGIYNVTIKDNNGCTLTQSVQVTQPTAITLTLTSVNANCTAANGTGSVSASGGTPAYTYNWSGGGGSGSQSNPLAAGIYSVTVTDANGCTKTGAVTINVTPGGTVVISASTNVSCFNGNDGTMTAGFTGAMSAPIIYSWSNGQVTQTATNLTAGSYSVTLTDAFGCTSSTSGVITQPAALDMATGTVAVSCYGGNNGSATAIYNGGGTPPLTYLWSPGGATTATAPNLFAGTYSVTVTDSKGCTVTLSVSITQPTSVTVTSTVTTANCGQANGSATVSATGGTPAYSYTWSTSVTGSTLSGALAGTYTITVKDANGCISTAAATIPNSAGPAIAIASQTNVSCFGGNNGIATTTVTGGATPYVYLWSNAQNTGIGTNLSANVYTVSVTDANGCVASTSVTITQPPALTLTASGTNPLCFNATNGTANVGVVGGTAAYTYSWIPSGSNVSNPTGLGPGNHIVTVTDANGCVASSSVSLSNPAQMTAALSATNVTCFGACNGVATATTANTVGAVIYFWTGGPGPLTTQTVTNLCPGTYTMQATDQNGCTASASVTISQPTQLTASISATGNASCAGYTNGFATVAPSGGTPAYTYSWLPSGGSLATANNLAAGSYTAVITDAMGCITNAVAVITQPTPLAATLTSTNITCNGLNNGIGNLTYSGGTGPYTFLWFPTLNNTPNVTTLPPGTHTVQVTDNLGCITTLTTQITQPAALTAAVSSTNSNCTQANGNACVLAAGGAGGYSYQWTSNPLFTNSCINNVIAGTYTVTVTDANGCTASAIAIINDISGPTVVVTGTTAVSCFGGTNGSATTNISGGVGTISVLWSYLAQTTPNVNNLPAGLHSITITDGAGCVASASVNITQPTQLNSAITSVSMVTCSGANNGSATMLLNGGTPAYSYTWTPSAQSSSIAVGMAPGVYTCSVTDANGCPTSQTVNISQPNPLQINSFSVTNLTCNGNNSGQISTNITGGTPAYTIVWNPTQPANPIITNLAAGTYSLLVTDTKSCTASGVYVVSQPMALSSSATATAATCGNPTGSATVTVNGGTPGYIYNWNTPTPQNTPVATGMASNIWSCVVTDANGCIITQSVNVPNAPGPVLSAMNYTAPLCFGQQNGSMSISFTSGTAPYTFLWNNPSASTTQTVNGVGAGVYSATVTDTYGCVASGVINVVQPNILLMNVSPDPTICYGQTAQIFAAGSGGTPVYTYSWTPAMLTPGGGPHSLTPTVTTSYMVSLTDINNCVTSPKIITINVTPQLLAIGHAATRCDGAQATFTPIITSPGNGGPYSYSWSNGSTSANLSVVANYATAPNMYTLTISDGCSIPNAVAVYTLDVNPLPSATITADPYSGCAPLSVNFSAITSSPNDVLNWTFGNGLTGTGNPVNTLYVNAGSYNVDLDMVNQFGCKMEYHNLNYITVHQKPIADFFPTPQSTSLLDPGILFTNTSINATSYFWDFGDYNSPTNNTTAVNPSHQYDLAGQYQVYLVAINDKGCTDTTMRIIEITPDYAIYIPNAFTPDGNGKNDIFQPKGVGIMEDDYKMYIFDRWGEIIFTSDEFSKGWDGKVKSTGKTAELGVYTYKILAKDMNGNVHPYVGHVTCIPSQSKVE